MDLHRKLLILLISALCPLTSVFGQTGSIFVDENHNGHKIFGLPTPVADDEAATKGYADSIVGGGGATNFLDLTDTPNSYSGQTLKVVRVNAGETALEFATAGGAAIWGSITGTLSDQTDLQTALDGKQPLDGDLSGLAALSGTHDIYYRSAADTWSPVTIGSGLDFTGATLSTTGVIPSEIFKTIAVSGQSDVVADSATDTLTLAAGSNITLTTNASTDTVTIASTGGGGGVTNIATTSPITGGPITTTGTIALDVGVDHAFTAAQGITLNNAVTAAKSDLLTLSHNSSGTPAQGFGTGILLRGKSNTTTNQDMARIAVDWDVAVHASRKSRLWFNAADSTGISSSGMYLFANGSLSLNDATEYGAGVFNSAGLKISGAAASGKFLQGNGTIYTASGYNLPTSVGSSGQFVQSNGTNLVITPYALPTAIAASGKVLQSSGSNVGFSTPAFPNASATSGKMIQSDGTDFVASTPTWPTTAATVGKFIQSDGTNWVASSSAWSPTYNAAANSNTSTNTGFASDQYITGSAVVPLGGFTAKGQYRCVFDMVKTNQGTTAIVITLRIGTAGTTGDTSRMTFTFGNATAAIDTGQFEIIVNFRSVGSGTSAVVSGYCRAAHNLATTGLFNNASQWTIVGAVSGGFDSSAATTIGLSFNGGTNFAGTNTTVQATMNQP